MRELSPTLGLPMVDYRCTVPSCDNDGAYRVTARCLNCRTDVVVLLTSGHETPSYGGPKCPACGCVRWSFGGLEDSPPPAEEEPT